MTDGGPLLLRNLPAPGKDLCFRSGSFGFLDITVAIVEKREARPANLIVRPEFGRFLPGFDRLGEAPNLHECHAERMPAVKKGGIEFHALTIFLHRALQLTDRE